MATVGQDSPPHAGGGGGLVKLNATNEAKNFRDEVKHTSSSTLLNIDSGLHMNQIAKER